MQRLQSQRVLGWAVIGAVLVFGCSAAGEQVPVRYTEGLVHGFLVLRTLEGDTIAGGELKQLLREGRVTNQLTFHFKDGSIHDETAVFTQRGRFRLLSYRLVQKGPVFPVPMDVSIDGPGGRVTVRYRDEDGEEKVETVQQRMPADIYNGMVLNLVKNIPPGPQETVVSMMATTPQPRLVKLKITALGEEPFSAGGIRHQAIHYVVKVDIGGFTGLLAKLLGKQPPDSHVWIVRGDRPGFVKAERPFYLGGPLWRIELASPVWSQTEGEDE
jgi:hypothetical protein